MQASRWWWENFPSVSSICNIYQYCLIHRFMFVSYCLIHYDYCYSSYYHIIPSIFSVTPFPLLCFPITCSSQFHYLHEAHFPYLLRVSIQSKLDYQTQEILAIFISTVAFAFPFDLSPSLFDDAWWFSCAMVIWHLCTRSVW